MFAALLWGSFLLVYGAYFLLSIFAITLPIGLIFQIFFSTFLIYLGFKLILSFKCKAKKYFSKKSCKFDDFYEVFFTGTTIDLSFLKNLNEEKDIKIVCRFSDLKIILPENTSVRVKTDAAFATVNLPNRSNCSEYVNLYGSQKPLLNIFIEAKFSSVSVKES